MSSVAERQQRHDEQASGEILVLRGRRRIEHRVTADTLPVLAPEPLELLGIRLNAHGLVLYDQFTRVIPDLRTHSQYHAYARAERVGTHRQSSTPEEVDQARMALQRRQVDILDQLHTDVWTNWQFAHTSRAAVKHVKDAKLFNLSLSDEGLRHAASAIEDFGFSLEASHVPFTEADQGLPVAIQKIGQYGALHPESLLQQHENLFLLVQRQQEQRILYWMDLLERYEQPDWGGNRRTPDQLQDEIDNNDFVRRMQAQA